MRLSARLHGDERGFTIVELLAGLMLSAMCFVLFSAALGGALRSSRDSRLQETATLLATEEVERARALSWLEVALSDLDPESPHLTEAGTHLAAGPTGLLADEPLLVCPAGAIVSHRTIDEASTSFDVWTYVTLAATDARRVVVVVDWALEGAARSYQTATLVTRVSAAGEGPGSGHFLNAAIMAMDDVVMSGGAYTATSAGTTHQASVLANGDFRDGTARVDGDLTVGGTATATVANIAGRIEQNAGVVVSMPDPADVAAWHQELQAAARTGTQYSGTVRFSNQTITAPIFVNGTIEFENSVTILGAGPIYATNAIKVRGAIVTTQASPLVAGTLVEFSGGGEYRVTQSTEGGIVSFGTNAQSLKLSGGSAGTTQGVAYAPYGGILLSGTSSWYGSLIAGGIYGTGDVVFSGGSSVRYPSGLTTASLITRRFAAEEVGSPCG